MNENTELEQMEDNELEALALSISVLDPRFRAVWQAYEKRGVGMIAQVLKTSKEREQIA
jgi:NADPH-dependent 7-cyano-7-deazaguanine reductase QueF